jgi:hypothetical protein
MSMTDFVLQQDITDIKQRDSIVNYANFLKQPLNLGMLVPCDNDENILEEPIYTTNHSDGCYCKECEEETKRCSNLQNQYQKAKEKVLFEGFENSTIDELKIMFKICKLNIIEDLLNYKEEIQLTENAIKQIGL